MCDILHMLVEERALEDKALEKRDLEDRALEKRALVGPAHMILWHPHHSINSNTLKKKFNYFILYYLI